MCLLLSARFLNTQLHRNNWSERGETSVTSPSRFSPISPMKGSPRLVSSVGWVDLLPTDEELDLPGDRLLLPQQGWGDGQRNRALENVGRCFYCAWMRMEGSREGCTSMAHAKYPTATAAAGSPSFQGSCITRVNGLAEDTFFPKGVFCSGQLPHYLCWSSPIINSHISAEVWILFQGTSGTEWLLFSFCLYATLLSFLCW